MFYVYIDNCRHIYICKYKNNYIHRILNKKWFNLWILKGKKVHKCNSPGLLDTGKICDTHYNYVKAIFYKPFPTGDDILECSVKADVLYTVCQNVFTQTFVYRNLCYKLPQSYLCLTTCNQWWEIIWCISG